MSYNLTPEELHEMRDWSGKAEQLVRLVMLPVGQLPYIKKALKMVQTDAFLPALLRKPFYKFIEEVMELALGEPGIYRLIRNKVAANRNDSVINRYMPEGTTMDETEDLNELSTEVKQRYVKLAQGDVKLFSKAIKWHKSADRHPAMKDKKIDAKLIAKHQKSIAKREKGIASAVKEQTLEEAMTSFKKLLRPNYYKDEKAKANVTQTAKIAMDATSKAAVTEDCKKLERPNPYKDEKAKANVTLTAKIADAAHSKAKVTEERDADERAGDREGREFKRKVGAYDKVAVDKAIASSRQKIGKKEGSAIHRLLKGRHESVEHNEESVFGEAVYDKNYLDLMAKRDSRLGAPTSAKEFKVGKPKTPFAVTPKTATEFMSKKTNEELEFLNTNLLDEDVNYRSTPQGMLQTMSNMVKIKKRHGGKVNVNDRKVASKARNELRRRKYFSATTISAEFDTAYLDLADVLAEEGIFLDEQQLDELKQVTMMRAYSDRMNKARHHRSLASSTARTLLRPKEDAGVRKNRALDAKHTKRADRTLWHMVSKSAEPVKEEVVVEVSDELKTRYAEKVKKNFIDKGLYASGRKQVEKVLKRVKTAHKILDAKHAKKEEMVTEAVEPPKSREFVAHYKAANPSDAVSRRETTPGQMDKRQARVVKLKAALDKTITNKKVAESVESLEELSKKTIGSYTKKALVHKSDADFNLGVHSNKKNENQDYPIFSDKKKDGGLGGVSSVNKLLRTTEKRGKGISAAVTKMTSEAYKEDYSEERPDTYLTATKPVKKVRPSKSTWYKSVADAGDVKSVDPKMNVRFTKEEFEERFAKTLELFKVSSISELDEEMTKMFLSLVQSESKSDDDYQEKVYDKISAAKKKEGTLTPEQIRYRAEKQARAAKTQAILDSAKKELSATKTGSGWSKTRSDSE